jgi:hypothetical protein
MSLDRAPAVFGLVVGLVGLALAYIFYRNTIEPKSISWTAAITDILDPSMRSFPPGMTLRYKNTTLTDLTRINIFIWNSGRQPVIFSDIVSDTLCVFMRGKYKIIDACVIDKSRSVNHPQIAGISERENNEIVILVKFDFLDPGDGFNLEIYCTGNEGAFGVDGTLRGDPKSPRLIVIPPEVHLAKQIRLRHLLHRHVFVIAYVYFTSVLIISTLPILLPFISSILGDSKSLENWEFVIISIIYAVSFPMIAILIIRMLFRSLPWALFKPDTKKGSRSATPQSRHSR